LCSGEEVVVALSVDQTTLIDQLLSQRYLLAPLDEVHDRYYEGIQRLEQIGLAVPPELRRFETVVNWPALVVDSVTERIKLKSFILPGKEIADPGLYEGWTYNNLDSDQSLLWNDKCVYGRGFMAVGANEEESEYPLITVESPREITVKIDPRTRRVIAALRLYGDPLMYGGALLASVNEPMPKYATLYEQNSTTWLSRDDGGRWAVVDVDQHNLGRVAIVPFFNRRRTGRWQGVSEMRRAISLTDAAARSLTNLQIASETTAVPQKWALGLSKGDFVDKDGNPLPVWEAYYGAIWSSANKDAKVGQFDAASLSNFHETVNFYGGLLAGLYGLPMRYMGQQTANPPSADGIRADEARLILRAEQHMSMDADSLGQVMALYMRFRDGKWPDGNRISVDWFDAATPTYASKTDGIQKLTGGAPILSRQGGWDELGWSDARKAREKDYFDQEATDPTLERIARGLTEPPLTPVNAHT
jgi:hypothetical protein